MSDRNDDYSLEDLERLNKAGILSEAQYRAALKRLELQVEAPRPDDATRTEGEGSSSAQNEISGLRKRRGSGRVDRKTLTFAAVAAVLVVGAVAALLVLVVPGSGGDSDGSRDSAESSTASPGANPPDGARPGNTAQQLEEPPDRQGGSGSAGIVGAGDVNPRGLPELDVGDSIRELDARWGPVDEDVLGYRTYEDLGVNVLADDLGRIQSFEVNEGDWRTPSGARLGMNEVELKGVYPTGLNSVPYEGRLLRAREQHYVTAGGGAIVFVFSEGRIIWMVATSAADAEDAARFAGPV